MHTKFLIECKLIRGKDNLWGCPECGWVCKHKFSKPPRRNCTNSPDITEAAERLGITGDDIKAKMLAELKPITDRSDVPQCTLAAVTAQLDQCLTPCKEFNGQVCTFRGSKCKYWQRWKEFLALTGMPCRAFEASPP